MAAVHARGRQKESMSKSRSQNTILNIIFGYAAQIGTLVLSFFGRRIFLQYLSVDYLGINGLYSNILTVLSLAELGLDTAVIYSLYKPVADGNEALINSLLVYFKKIYFVLAGVIFLIGMALVPFLHFLIKSELNRQDLIYYYLIFLANTIASYFVAHKVALLSAYQEQRVQKMVVLSSNLVLQILHIIVLVVWKSYYLYVLATLLTTIISNIALGCVCDRIHPNIKKKLPPVDFDKKPIREKVYSTFLYKVGAVLVTNTDNILISVLVSTAAVGLYSNYYVIYGSIQGFIAIITLSLISSLGNLGVSGDEKRQYEIFNFALLFYHFTAALGLVGFSALLNDVVELWLGAEYLLEWHTAFLIALNFYISNAISPVWMYHEAYGLFDQVRYLMLARAAVNLVLSVLLGMIWGTFGILLATAISLVVTSFWYEPIILFKKVFHLPVREYWRTQERYFFITLLAAAVCYGAISVLPHEATFLLILIKTLLIILLTTGIFFVFVHRTPEYDEIKALYARLRKSR